MSSTHPDTHRLPSTQGVAAPAGQLRARGRGVRCVCQYDISELPERAAPGDQPRGVRFPAGRIGRFLPFLCPTVRDTCLLSKNWRSMNQFVSLLTGHAALNRVSRCRRRAREGSTNLPAA